MLNSIKYFLTALFFVVLTKVLQLTVFDSSHFEKLQRESDSHETITKTKRISNEKLSEKQSTKKTSGIQEVSQSKKEGDRSNNDLTLSSLKKTYLAPILASIPEGELREDVVIRYYRRKMDKNSIDKLKALSYYIHKKEPDEISNVASNIMYYGDHIPLEDIQIVAFTLLEEGIPLKSIKHTKFDWKAKAIEIATDTTLLDDPNISLDEIKNFQKHR